MVSGERNNQAYVFWKCFSVLVLIACIVPLSTAQHNAGVTEIITPAPEQTPHGFFDGFVNWFMSIVGLSPEIPSASTANGEAGATVAPSYPAPAQVVPSIPDTTKHSAGIITTVPTPVLSCSRPTCAYGHEPVCPGTCDKGCGYICPAETTQPPHTIPTPVTTETLPTQPPHPTRTPTTTIPVTTCTPNFQCTIPVCQSGQGLSCRGNCCDVCNVFCSDAPPPLTPISTPEPTCTPLPCPPGQIPLCGYHRYCENGCGMYCGVPITVTPTQTVTPPQTVTPTQWPVTATTP